MYARTTTIDADPQRTDEGIAIVRDQVMPAVLEIEGCVGISMLVDRESGRCIATTAWRDEEAMRASASRVSAMRRQAQETLSGEMHVEEWEIAVVHRRRPAGDGACTRVLWTTGDAAGMDRMLETFRVGMLPRIEQLPGFCSVSVLVGREVGRMVTAVSYENRTALEASRERAAAMRAALQESTGISITEVAEFDLVLAHLRVPETV